MSQSDGFDDMGFNQGEAGNFSPMALSTQGTLKVKNTTYAVGLYWEGVEAGSNAAAQARERADNADFFCVFSVPNKTQIGMGNRSQGHKANMPSLAAHIASGRANRFLALFQVDGGFYLLGVREDGINPLLERFIASREEAMEAYEDAKGEDWEEMIAPNSFGWQDTTEVHIDDCLRGRPPVRLKEVKRSGSIVKYSIIGLLVVGGIFGVQYWNQINEDNRIAEEFRLAAEKAAATVLPGQQEKIEIPEAPWVNKTIGSHFVKKCVEDIKKFPLDVPGWKVTGFTCENPHTPVAAATLVRGGLGNNGGPVNWITPYVETDTYKPVLGYSSAGSADTVSAQWELFDGASPKVPIDQVTLPVGQVRLKLLQVMEARFTPVQTQSSDLGQFYRALDFSFDTKLDPLEYLDVISAIPGAVIEGVDYGLDNNTWKIRGKSYEQLPLPPQVKN